MEAEEEGEMLVLSRALSGIKRESEEVQRDCPFHTRCTVKGKIFSFIIDRGSCTNVAPTTMVEKLKPPTTALPQPYTI